MPSFDLNLHSWRTQNKATSLQEALLIWRRILHYFPSPVSGVVSVPGDLTSYHSSAQLLDSSVTQESSKVPPMSFDQPRVPATKEGPRAPRPGLGEHGTHPPLPQSSSHHSPPPPPQRQRKLPLNSMVLKRKAKQMNIFPKSS